MPPPPTTDTEDARFVAALRCGDERAFARLVLDHQDRVHNVVYRLLGSREEAEDVTQDVFVTVYEKLDRFRGDSKLSTWIFRIAANHAKNRIKYLSRRHDRERDCYDDMAAPPTGGPVHADVPRPDQMAAGHRLEAFVQRALMLLDEDQREAVVLRDIEGLPYEEVAVVVGASLGTVKSRLHRGRLKLKDALDAFMAGEDPTRAGAEVRGPARPRDALPVETALAVEPSLAVGAARAEVGL